MSGSSGNGCHLKSGMGRLKSAVLDVGWGWALGWSVAHDEMVCLEMFVGLVLPVK